MANGHVLAGGQLKTSRAVVRVLRCSKRPHIADRVACLTKNCCSAAAAAAAAAAALE